MEVELLILEGGRVTEADTVSERGWDKVKSWDDALNPLEADLTERLIADNDGKKIGHTCVRCPHLEKKGEGFFYCLAEAEQYKASGLRLGDSVPTPNSAEYLSHVDHMELQLWCLNGHDRYAKCIHFQQSKRLTPEI